MAGAPPTGPPGTVPPGDNSYPQWGVRPSDGKVIEATSQGAKLADIKQGYVDWFTSNAAAQAQAKIQTSTNPLITGGPVLNIPNPLAGVLEIGHWIGVLVTSLTDAYMWRSLGWLALGLVLLIAGIVIWLRQQDILPDVAPVPVPV